MKNYVTIARRFAGLSQTQLAESLGMSQQYVSALESGARNPGPNLAPKLAKLLDVSTAWLTGRPQSLPLYSVDDDTTYICEIMREENIPDYGILYHVYVDVIGDIVPVIVTKNVMFCPWQWDNCPCKSADDIQDYRWCEPHSNSPAIMLDGLPRIF